MLILTRQTRAKGQKVTQQATSRPKTRSIRRVTWLRRSIPQSVQVSWKCGWRRLGDTRLHPSFRFDTKNSCIQPSHVFTTLYGYASLLARQVSKLSLLDQMSGIRLSRLGKTTDILIVFGRLTHVGLSPPFVGSGTDILADTRADIGGHTQICTDLEVIPSFLEIRSRSSVDG